MAMRPYVLWVKRKRKQILTRSRAASGASAALFRLGFQFLGLKLGVWNAFTAFESFDTGANLEAIKL